MDLQELIEHRFSFKDLMLISVCSLLFGTIVGFLMSPKKTETNYIKQIKEDKEDFNADLAMEMSELR